LNNFKLYFNLDLFILLSDYKKKIWTLKNSKTTDILILEYLGKTTFLRVVDDSDETIQLLTKWRKDNWDGYTTKFQPTFESTKIYLNKIIKDENQILFLIIHDDKKIGHMGISYYDDKDDSIWLENWVKGNSNVAPGIMEYIERLFLKWIFDEFNNSHVKAFIFSDNFKTIRLHEKCGWLTLKSIPLKREFNKDGWKWIPTTLSSDEEYGERYFLLMGKENPEKRSYLS
jgi:RimJ/RimL family protein N-acetyltransferase